MEEILQMKINNNVVRQKKTVLEPNYTPNDLFPNFKKKGKLAAAINIHRKI